MRLGHARADVFRGAFIGSAYADAQSGVRFSVLAQSSASFCGTRMLRFGALRAAGACLPLHWTASEVHSILVWCPRTVVAAIRQGQIGA